MTITIKGPQYQQCTATCHTHGKTVRCVVDTNKPHTTHHNGGGGYSQDRPVIWTDK